MRLPSKILQETFDALVKCGQGRCECVIYWTGPIGESKQIDGWDHPTHRRSPWGYKIDDRWLTDYWFRLGRNRRKVLAQVHTHPEEAFHSITDDCWPVVSQSGFVSVVIPNFALGPTSLEGAWIGRLSSNGQWRNINLSEAIKVSR